MKTRLTCAAALLFALVTPASASAEALTIKAGESWLFAVERGEPVKARRVAGSAKPARGQIKASLVSGMGTTLTVTNNSPLGYTFRADLVGAGNATAAKARTCTLPPNRKPVLEYWPVKAAAVRLSAFKVTSADGNCP